MGDENTDPYGDLVRRVVAHEIEPETAAVEAVTLLVQEKGEEPTVRGLSLSFLGLSEPEAERLARFARAVQDGLIRRLASESDSG